MPLASSILTIQLSQVMEVLLNRCRKRLFLVSLSTWGNGPKLTATFSVWQERRVVITKELLSFAFANMDDEVDRVPLAGVDYVRPHDESGSIEQENSSHEYYCVQVEMNCNSKAENVSGVLNGFRFNAGGYKSVRL